MKRVLLFVCIMLAQYFCAKSQDTDFPPCYAYDTIGKDTLLSIGSHGNFLYVGIDNSIQVNHEKFPFDCYKIVTNNGIVDDVENLAMPSQTGIAVYSVYGIKENDTVFLFNKIMQVKSLPQPYISCGGYNLYQLKYIKRQFFSANDRFEVRLSHDFIDDSNWFTIKEITIGYSFGGMYVTKTCNGNTLSAELKNAINQLMPGKEITLLVKAFGGGEMLINLPPIKLLVY